jgi:hypothetical protein
VKGLLTINLVSKIGESFTTDYEPEDALQSVLRQEFGHFAFTHFCADMSGTIYRLTFSEHSKPGVLIHEGVPICIMGADADPFELYVQDIEVINGGRVARRPLGETFITLRTEGQ